MATSISAICFRFPPFLKHPSNRNQATSETVDKVCQIVKTQLALPAKTAVTPGTTSLDLGAESLDTVEIVMTLKEEFGINIEEGAAVVSTIQEAADVIEELVAKKSQA